VHRGVRITGDCRVGGTAEMLSGTYTTGEYMSGKHTGGDPKSLTDRAMSAIKSAL
jgi:hypothetical protein